MEHKTNPSKVRDDLDGNIQELLPRKKGLKWFLSPKQGDNSWKWLSLPNWLDYKEEEDTAQSDLQNSVIIIDPNKSSSNFLWS